MNAMAMSLESNLIANNAMIGVIGTAFNAVENGFNIVKMCSDCCGSNGNDCDPTEQL